MFQRTKICSGLLIAFGSALATGVHAQDTEVQRVEVTGSSIKRIASEGALPIQTLTADDIRKSGATSVTDLIQALPSMQGFQTESQSVNGGGGGVTSGPMIAKEINPTLQDSTPWAIIRPPSWRTCRTKVYSPKVIDSTITSTSRHSMFTTG